MTELIINGERAVLSQDLNFQMIEENPFFTRNGEFSLDITLSLMNSTNQKIFKHINRLNAEDFSEASAQLIVDNKVTLGRIVDIENSDTSVSFQFVAGNSELNYMSGDEKKIWELNFGKETAIDYAQARITTQSYGFSAGYGYVCCPVEFSNLTANKHLIQPAYYDTDFNVGEPAKIYDIQNIVMQPYLMYYINKLPGLLGFKLVENALEDDVLADLMVIPNRVKSLRYSDALPDLTISEFIKAIETFFNVLFIVNKNKECRIINVDSTYGKDKTFYSLNNVLDTYSREPEEDQESFEAVSYDLSQEGYLRYQKLTEDVLDACSVVKLSNPASLAALPSSQYEKLVLYQVGNYQEQYVYAKNPAMNVFGKNVFAGGRATNVNKFRDSSKIDNPLVLPISPVAFTYKIITIMREVRNTWSTDKHKYECPYQLPFINEDVYVPEESLIMDSIENSIKQNSRKDKLEVFLYAGEVKLFQPDLYAIYEDMDIDDMEYFTDFYYPLSYVDNLPEFYISSWMIDENITDETDFMLWIEQEYASTCNKTLRLAGQDNLFDKYHEKNQDIDTSKIYIFEVLDDVNITKQYFYEGAIYIPFSIEKNITIDGEEKIKIVKCYKLK